MFNLHNNELLQKEMNRLRKEKIERDKETIEELQARESEGWNHEDEVIAALHGLNASEEDCIDLDKEIEDIHFPYIFVGESLSEVLWNVMAEIKLMEHKAKRDRKPDN